jgi:hypothetical protein
MQFGTLMNLELKRLPIPACGAPHQTIIIKFSVDYERLKSKHVFVPSTKMQNVFTPSTFTKQKVYSYLRFLKKWK